MENSDSLWEKKISGLVQSLVSCNPFAEMQCWWNQCWWKSIWITIYKYRQLLFSVAVCISITIFVGFTTRNISWGHIQAKSVLLLMYIFSSPSQGPNSDEGYSRWWKPLSGISFSRDWEYPLALCFNLDIFVSIWKQSWKCYTFKANM